MRGSRTSGGKSLRTDVSLAAGGLAVVVKEVNMGDHKVSEVLLLDTLKDISICYLRDSDLQTP